MSGSRLLRLRGLPYSAAVQDVEEFFGTEYDVQDVYLGAKNGKPTGEAYVEFKTVDDAARALKEKQHEHMGSRYIELFKAAEADLVAQGSGVEGAEATLSGHVVRLRGLPFTSTSADVVAFFEGVEVVGGEEGVVFTCTPDGRPTGEAYVELPDEEAAQAALGRHKERIGSRYIEIFQSSKGDMYQAVQQHGYFTTAGGRRTHHWHGPHGGGGGAAAAAGQAAAAVHAAQQQYMMAEAAAAAAGGRGGVGGGMDDMANAFAGFGISARDMQVPGPPRYGAYAAPGDAQYPGVRAMAPQAVPGGPVRWPPAAQMQAGMVRPQQMQQFNPAPGPPPGKGRGGGGRGSGAGGGMMAHEYSGQAVMVNPFMIQHPFMVPQQQQGSPWGGNAMMAAQQMQNATAWYGNMQMAGRGMQMGMGNPYTAYASGYFPMRSGVNPSSMGPASGLGPTPHHVGSRGMHMNGGGGTAGGPPPPPPPPPPGPAPSEQQLQTPVALEAAAEASSESSPAAAAGASPPASSSVGAGSGGAEE